ncbi:arginine--tRNA ligase [Candidatus Gracilibacteria bacterium]|nr:arginine--tRNA ligase [Candidatus Gracilibacteria bacterium]
MGVENRMNTSFTKENNLSQLNTEKMLNISLNTEEKNFLKMQNDFLHKKTLLKIQEIKQAREKHGFINYADYFINKLFNDILTVLKSCGYGIVSISDINFDFIDRNKFDGDICVRIPKLLKQFKNKEYITEIIPHIIEVFNNSDLVSNGIIKRIDPVGIYINITLGDQYMFNSLKDVFEGKERFGENNIHQGESIIVDYSSPNIAKHLHAGHIRSTLIGEALSNLYTANGYTTHRINHINDRGGFGFLIEGFYRRESKIKNFKNKNDLLFSIYTQYRKGEKVAKSEEIFLTLSPEELSELQNFYGPFEGYKDFLLNYTDFVEESKKRFSALEKGSHQETNLWMKMVGWSMEDFASFYDLLDVHQDYLLGESFYAEYGLKYIMDMCDKGKVILYSDENAKKDREKLDQLLDQNIITQEVYEELNKEIFRDIGAYIVDLGNFERFVVLKGDKTSIYATRDIGAIKYRYDTFSPDKIVYEVGQEQEDHFDKLFKSIKKFGIDSVDFRHVYHGFYVESKTKKKLSSRDGASNVQNLIQEAISYFKAKYLSSNKSAEEVDDIAKKLAVGSIIFNDLKQDRRNPVPISSNIEEACKNFEDSGGAYILYSIARANSVLDKAQNGNEIGDFIPTEIALSTTERMLLIEINKYPLIVKKSEEQENPAILLDWLGGLCRLYNSYYASQRVILEDGSVNEVAYALAKAFKQVAKNATVLCNIATPERI